MQLHVKHILSVNDIHIHVIQKSNVFCQIESKDLSQTTIMRAHKQTSPDQIQRRSHCRHEGLRGRLLGLGNVSSADVLYPTFCIEGAC